MSYRIGLACCMLLGMGGSHASAGIRNGDILINTFENSSIGHYVADGTLLTTFLGTGSSWEGASLTPLGQVVTTRRNPSRGVNIFDADGTEIFTFDTPEVTFVPADINVFADGVLAVNDQAGNVDLYTQAGIYITTYTAPDMDRAFGGFVDSSDTLWVADTRTVGGANGAIYRFARDGTLLDMFELGWEPGDLVVAEDGTLWVSERNDHVVMHLSATGTPIDSFPTAVVGKFNTIGVGLDGSIWAGGEGALEILQYSPDGVLIGSFPLTNPGSAPVFMTISRGLCLQVISQEIVCHADGTTFTVNIEGFNACTGGTIQVSFTGSGGAVGEQLCFTILVNDGGFCCSTEICVTIPDCTPAALPSDLDGDGIVGMGDFLALLGAWGPCSDCGTCPADFDGDCSVGILDLLILLGDWE